MKFQDERVSMDMTDSDSRTAIKTPACASRKRRPQTRCASLGELYTNCVHPDQETVRRHTSKG